MRTKFHFLFLVILTFLAVSNVTAQAKGDLLVSRVAVFQGQQQISSNSPQTIGHFALGSKILASATPNTSYKWRFHLFYSVDQKTADFAVQVRMAVSNNQTPTFTLNWDKENTGMRSAYTNWLRPSNLVAGGNLPVSINVKTETGEQTVTLQLVELEVWQEEGSNLDKMQVKQATAPTIIKPQVDKVATPKGNPTELAREAGIAFLQAAASGNQQAVKQLIAKEVVSLSSLQPLSASNLPLFKLTKGKTFNDYEENYDPAIYSYAEFEGLFDDWESHFSNGWQVSSKSYLFIGNNLNPWGTDVFADQPLVFVLEEENGQMKVKAFP